MSIRPAAPIVKRKPPIAPVAWLVAPALLLFVVFFALPFGVMAMLSLLSGNPVNNPNVVFTWKHYDRFIEDSAGIFHDALWSTLRIGLVTTIAADRAVAAGADRASLKTIETEDMPIAYLPGNAVRVRVRVVGDVADRGGL